MISDDVSERVRKDLESYEYESPSPGSTIGVPWSAEKVEEYKRTLEGCLVTPYLQKFWLADTYDQCQAEQKEFVQYWVVASKGAHFEYFDPETEEYGLGQLLASSSMPFTIGVRGDLVGVFCSI